MYIYVCIYIHIVYRNMNFFQSTNKMEIHYQTGDLIKKTKKLNYISVA